MALSIATLVSALETIAPLDGAADWDNVGLLVRGNRPIQTIGLTIDLTMEVWEELDECDAIVAYHPPIFRGVKRLDGSSPQQRMLLELIRRGVHLYSPHTALDAAVGGMAEWLASALVPVEALQHLRPVLVSPHDPHVGVGRRAEVRTPFRLGDQLSRAKKWLGLRHLRVAGDLEVARASIAVCPGSGGSVLGGLSEVGVLLTGEMGHHEVLAHVAAGGAVVLTDHTNCERGFLPEYAVRIGRACPEVVVRISTRDRDPLRVV